MKAERLHRGIRRTNLADQIGMSKATLRLIERGARRPSQPVLRRFCEVLELPLLPWLAAGERVGLLIDQALVESPLLADATAVEIRLIHPAGVTTLLTISAADVPGPVQL